MAKKIWIIDDDEGILDGFYAMLEGYDVKTSPNGDILQDITKENMPDLIFLDILLSGVDGREICKRMKKNAATKHIPIIMMSAATDVKKSVFAACADQFLPKPFEMDEVLEKVRKYTV